MITENTKFTFGKHRGKPLKNCPGDYLKWVSENLLNTDFHEWAVAAKQVLATLASEGKEAITLESQADEFLKKHGFGKYGQREWK